MHASNHPHHRHADECERYDALIAHLQLARTHAERQLEAIDEALDAARRAGAHRRSPDVDVVVDRAVDIRLHAQCVIAQVDEAVPIPPAPPRVVRPQRTAPPALSYTPPANADAA